MDEPYPTVKQWVPESAEGLLSHESSLKYTSARSGCWKPPGKCSMHRIVMHVDLDSFYASLEELRNPKAKGKPIVICVYSGRSADSGVVSTANYKARELGIKAGMPIAFAKRLARDRDVVFLPNDIEHYRTASERIMELLSEEGDSIEQVSIDEAYLDVTARSGDDWGNAEKIAEEIKRRLKQEEGLTCSVGIGPNKFIAKMASDYKKPDGLTVVRDAQVSEFLSGLPISELYGVGEKTTRALNDLEIRTVKELAGFDRLELEKVFGKNRARLLQEKAKGIDDSPVQQSEVKQISRIGTLKEDTADLPTITEKLMELTADLKSRIEKKRVMFRTVSIIAIDTDLKTQTKSETVPETDNLEVLSSTARSLLERYLKENLGRTLRRVGVRVSGLIPKDEKGEKGLDIYLS
ncbi:MAG: DNA polymerase IV [Candidatus Bathyarchaeia archaeon]